MGDDSTVPNTTLKLESLPDNNIYEVEKNVAELGFGKNKYYRVRWFKYCEEYDFWMYEKYSKIIPLVFRHWISLN